VGLAEAFVMRLIEASLWKAAELYQSQQFRCLSLCD
jgi:hypothetical protein